MRALAATLSFITLAWLAGAFSTPTATAQQGGRRSSGLKICKATNNEGRVTNWGCQINQSCCFNTATNQGFCGPVGGGC